MTMCAYLMEMQQYYRWENGIPYSMNLKKNEVGAWLAEREKFWNEIENLPYSPLPIGEEFDPFEAETVNRRIIPGFGLRVRPRPHRPACSSSERDHLSAQGGNLPHVWEKTGLWKKNDTADPETALEALVEKESEAIILHELGEGMAGELLGSGWENMLASASVGEEVLIRGVRDLLADCLSTLPVMIERGILSRKGRKSASRRDARSGCRRAVSRQTGC